MLNVANSNNDSDDILKMLESARRQTSIEIPRVAPDPVYHRAMSRRKSLAQDNIHSVFTLPSTPPESEEDSASSDDDERSSDDTDDGKEESSDNVEMYIQRNSIKKKTPENQRASLSPAKKRLSRKIAFLRARSSSSQNFNVTKLSSSRFQRMSRRLSLNNLLSNVSENENVALDQNEVNRTRSRRASLPVINPFPSAPKMSATLPEVEETVNNNSYPNKQRKKSSSRIFSLRKSRASSSDLSDSEDTSAKDSLESQSDEVENKRMAMGLNEASDNDMGTSSEVDPSMGERRGRKSVKNVLKNSFFMSRKSKKKNSFSGPSSAENSEALPKRQFKRRTSRLEMGIPIEEVFAGVEFKTIEKPIAVKVSDDENGVIEDPDDLIKSVQEQRRKSSVAGSSDQDDLENKFSALTSDNNDSDLKTDSQT